jgi:hypothetical protein
MDISNLLAITFKEKLKIKVAKWGKPKNIFFKLQKWQVMEIVPI